ncbi:hypothetical protein NM688_g6209 [Phlebia brevispora]|uniref:Uncharacterized protein n=1 Tax=Phlebia brevispora TaxID=194682 RepID=A0ACC1SIT7_9APHY|nr:hypothetical protein NM688_g6209 [Phlebia brevispora]
MTATLQDVKDRSFDYIIAGGGAAGLTLAARLSEDASKTVCVLEAGGANLNDPLILRPAGYGSHFGNRSYDWAHETTKQKLLNDRVCSWNRGRGLGGSSAINFMVYTKPGAEEMNDIERLGNPGWNWKNFQKYVQKSEGYVDPTPETLKHIELPDVTGLGRHGPLAVSYPPIASGLEKLSCDAMHTLGLCGAPKPFDGDVTGAYLTPNTRDPKTHTRSYSVTAYYLPNVDRPNLIILVNAHVRRVVTEQGSGENLTATGVEFEYEGKVHVAHAKSDVILSAGTLRSPQILELSGIGRADVLFKIGVPQKVDLPGVGENMQEHIVVSASHELKDDADITTFDCLRDPVQLAKQIELYEHGTGVFTMGIIGFAFLPLSMFSPNAQQIYDTAKAFMENIDKTTAPPGLLDQYEVMLERLMPGNDSSPGCEFLCFPGMFSQPNPPKEGKKYVSLSMSLNHLFSRGTIHCVSKDPAQEPEIDAHYFERNVDLQVYTEMFRLIRKLAETSPLKEVIVSELNPGPRVQTDEQIQEWLKQSFTTTWPVVYSLAEQAADIIKGQFRG